MQNKQPNQRSKAATVQQILGAEVGLQKPPEQVTRLGQIQYLVALRHQISFSGILPHPDIIAEYERVLSGSAERIVAMAEKEQNFRHAIRESALSGAMKRDKRGQWMGFVTTVCILLIASIFAYSGKTIFAGTLIGLDLLGLATLFVIGRRPEKKRHSQLQ